MIKENACGKSCFYKKSAGTVKVEQLPRYYIKQKEVHNTGRVAEPFVFFRSLDHLHAFYAHHLCMKNAIQ